MKNFFQLLVSMDGIHVFDDDHSSVTYHEISSLGLIYFHERVLVIAATNLPQQIDDAVLRRFGKRIPVPMPDATTRKHVILKLVEDSPTEMSQDDQSRHSRKKKISSWNKIFKT